MAYYGGSGTGVLSGLVDRARGAGSDPRQARFLTLDSARWVVRHRAWSRWHLVRYWRFAMFKVRNPHVVTQGLVFLGRGTDVHCTKGLGTMVLGRWVHVGDGNALRCHEGHLRVGDKAVFGKDNVVNCYLDVEVGEAALVADWVYVCDFDHVTEHLDVPVKDQGIVKSPVRIGPDTWVGTKVTVTRGVQVGRGAVLAANSVVTRDVPDHAVVGGVPARVLKDRRAAHDAAADARAGKEAALADIARKNAEAAAAVRAGRG